MLVLAGLLAVVAPATAAPLDLERVTVAELQERMAAGELTSVELTEAYIDRIAALNNRGPGLNAVRMLNPDALRDAARLDRERRKGTGRGLLHGIPVLVKDNLDVAGLPTTAGAPALERSIAPEDSTVVARLRTAGAVILSKTNLSEFANFITNSNPSGYSGLGGQVLNALAAVQSAGATTVQIPTPAATPVPSVLAYEFKRDLNAYLDRLPESAPMDSLADIIAYNDAHSQEALKFGQTQLVAGQAVDLSPGSADTAAYEANLAAGKAANRAAIDTALTRATADPTDDLDAIMTQLKT